MNQLSANDLKTRGVAAIESALEGQDEAVIAVRGKPRFVVMDVEAYYHLRECEIDAALAEARGDVEAGRVVRESPEEHLARLDRINAEATQSSHDSSRESTR